MYCYWNLSHKNTRMDSYCNPTTVLTNYPNKGSWDMYQLHKKYNHDDIIASL